MYFKGLDRTLGAPMLIEIAYNEYQSLSDQQKFIQFQDCEEFKKLYRSGKDYVVNLLCQYSTHYKDNFELGDILWWRNIKKLIIDGNLYMALHETENFAFPDKMFNENSLNLAKIGVSVTEKNKHNSDGLWEMDGVLRLFKVYPGGENTPKDPEYIDIENPHGVVEFGTQKICKSAATLLMNDCLLRVPYKANLKFERTMCAFFYNISSLP
ncbi:hypothetical protein [Aquimarina sp. Aq78]|uniref:hypothetical protein n=1 Tax=Aquimarina sp. Aq78 TaxID=1191889 RepID=UPI000D111C6C|nr:hypothetical protein [Aquimarina sp. Aq78]